MQADRVGNVDALVTGKLHNIREVCKVPAHCCTRRCLGAGHH